jgi:hypothetical protein
MSRKTTLAAALVAAAMIAGTLGPWATQQTVLGQSTVPGMDHGGLVVILLAVMVMVLALADRPTLLGVCALAAALWLALVMYGLPGALTSAGAGQADMTWGAYLALAGCVVALGAALRRERALAEPQGAHHAAVVGRPEA